MQKRRRVIRLVPGLAMIAGGIVGDDSRDLLRDVLEGEVEGRRRSLTLRPSGGGVKSGSDA